MCLRDTENSLEIKAKKTLSAAAQVGDTSPSLSGLLLRPCTKHTTLAALCAKIKYRSRHSCIPRSGALHPNWPPTAESKLVHMPGSWKDNLVCYGPDIETSDHSLNSKVLKQLGGAKLAKLRVLENPHRSS